MELLACVASSVALIGCSTGHRNRPQSHESTSTQSVASCSASQLSSVGGWQGATQSMLGAISLSNRGATECELRGYLTVAILDRQGAVLHVKTRHGTPQTGTPSPKVENVLLPPGKADAAQIFVQWFNWCGADPSPITVRLTLPDGETLGVPPGQDPWAVEDCQSPAGPSVLQIGPVQRPS
jgi:Protein of unknown function (DUF4232)